MDWTSLYFKTTDLKVLILGTGEVATRRANRFLDKNSEVILIGNLISEELSDKGAILKDESDIDTLVKWSDLIIIATGNESLAKYVTKIAKDKLINRADCPDKGNLIVPTTFNIENIEISIFTNGKSPLMAKELRRKIQSIITAEDILEIEVQNFARELLKGKINNQKDRKKYLYSFFEDEKIASYIKNHDLNGAKEYLKTQVDNI
ncbi:bifunctional precorrin-2 dehydrogenase/sirohydrochlorin ferrochelatase [Methanobrevibacter sp. DSM 116169]|uniref:precorrin-2 dehydrogenase/sirohydrochlorin ferrochelatase family protein n=1 Tax=Methanobrevibacter sp. DSM 116169 TaxID=3242727 RepID=UPI0038FC2C01